MHPVDQQPAHEARSEVQQERQRVAYCRCWQSQNFPYCDGSHRQYQAETGLELGPVVVSTESS